MPLIDSSVDWAQLRKESVNFNICQRKFPKLKWEEKNTEYLRTVG